MLYLDPLAYDACCLRRADDGAKSFLGMLLHACLRVCKTQPPAAAIVGMGVEGDRMIAPTASPKPKIRPAIESALVRGALLTYCRGG